MDILISIAAKVSEYAVAPIGRQLGYLFFYKRNIADLNTQIDALKNVRESLQHEVEEAKSDARGIEAGVNDWLAKADKIISEDHGDFTRHEEQANTKFTCGAKFPNLVLRHQLSRRARKMAETFATQIQKREKINRVSYRLNLPISVGNKGYEDFESRNRTLTHVMEALRDPTVGMVGLSGMGGVGKTMLAKEVARRAMDEEKLFTMVVFATISQEPNIKNILQDIGEKLGMRFHEESKHVRAERLRDRLRQENNIFIILDDIWGKLDLEDVGICFGGTNQKGCKILVTTRYRHVLANDMDVDSTFIFDVGVLSEHEAMSLFRKIVGDQVEEHDDLATQIVKECGQLPIAITTVASALKNKGCAVWKNALHELRKSNPITIDGMHEKVYSSIKLSYDYLKTVEAKHLLLLCSLFPEDEEIEIRVLCHYGFGLNMFEDVNTLEEARNKTDALVTKLKDHSLLLDADSSYLGYDRVKLHDVIRDVVIYVASKLDDHHRMHNIRNVDELEKYFNKEMFKDSTAISLYGIEADEYTQTMTGPELNLLRLAVPTYYSEELPHQFFEGLNKLLVLDSSRTSLKSLAPTSSFCFLPNLQTLRLTRCTLGDISWIGELESLKILDLSFNNSITELPSGIGKLNRLLSLNVQGCGNLKVIEPNVISSLTRLEELNLKNSFTNWEVERVANADDERRNTNLSEVKELRHLNDLNLDVPNINSLPKDIFSENLEKYYIRIGDYQKDYDGLSFDVRKITSRTLKLKLCPNSVLNEHDFAALLGRSDALNLTGLKIVKSVAFEIDRMSFQHLKHLIVEESTEIRCIVNWNNENMDCLPAAFPSLESLFLGRLMNLENIIHEKLTTKTSFGKLREIEVSNCDKLKSLFSLSNIPRQLECIKVKDCEMMEEIISHDGKEGDHVKKMEISQLKSLRLSGLPKLVQFIATNKSHGIKREGRQSIDAQLFNGQVVFPKLEDLNIISLNIQKFWNNDQLPSSRFGFQSLTQIQVSHYDHLKGLIPSWMTASFVHLRRLKVEHCKAMKEIVFIEESTQVMGIYVSFPRLESLELDDLPNLKRFCEGDISLPTLDALKLDGLPNLERFCRGVCIDCPSLSELEMRDCQKLKIFMTNIEKKDENSTVANKHISHHQVVVKVDQLSTESSCWEITCQPHPFGYVEEHDEYFVFKTKRLSLLKLWNLPNQHQLPKTFPTVESLSIAEWGITLKDLATPLMSFQNLKDLRVIDCHGLTSLFSPSTAKILSQRLRGLAIVGCKSLRQVIADDDADNINIIFSQLESLVLYDLSNLTSFYPGNNNVVLQFPCLVQLIVGCCPEMRTFCHGNIHCPSLHSMNLTLPYCGIRSVMWDYKIHRIFYYPYWKGDINTTIQKLWEDKNIRDSPPETEESVETCKLSEDSAEEEEEIVGPKFIPALELEKRKEDN